MYRVPFKTAMKKGWRDDRECACFFIFCRFSGIVFSNNFTDKAFLSNFSCLHLFCCSLCLYCLISLFGYFALSVTSCLITLLSPSSVMSLCQTAQGGGHRTLLYGHAVLLRHSYSGMVSEHTHKHTYKNYRLIPILIKGTVWQSYQEMDINDWG